VTVKLGLEMLGAPLGADITVPFASGMNVQDALEAGFQTHADPRFSFALKYFGTLGYEVTELDSIANQVGSEPDSYLFWALYVNGILSPTGIDQTGLSDGDQVKWRYQRYMADEHAGTRHEAIRDRLMQ